MGISKISLVKLSNRLEVDVCYYNDYQKNVKGTAFFPTGTLGLECVFWPDLSECKLSIYHTKQTELWVFARQSSPKCGFWPDQTY